MMRRAPIWISALAALYACSAPPQRPVTIGELKSRPVEVHTAEPAAAGSDRARERYQEFLDLNRGDAQLRAEAMRRLGDLKLEAGESARIEKDLAQGSPLDTTDAIVLFSKLYKAYPDYPRNDSVLYQLARAYEADQQMDRALATLDLLIRKYPNSPHIDEAQFRRGEILFSAKRYADAEAAYAAVIAIGPASSFYEHSLYKHGWSQFKLGEGDVANDSFGKLLDRKLVDSSRPDGTVDLNALTRPQRELVDDTLRVMSITFSGEDGAKSLDAYLTKHGPAPYSWLQYAALGDLYVTKERYTDAADTYRAFGARDPDHDMAPVLQNRAIEAYKKGGFAALVLDGKREFVERYQLGSAFWVKRAPQAPADAAPEVVRELKSNIEDLAAYYHEQAQASKKPADYEEAARWYRAFLHSFPDDPDAPKTNYLLADTLFESHLYRDAAVEYERTAYAYPPNDKSATAGYAALVAYDKAEAELTGEAKLALHKQALDSGLRFASAYPEHPESANILVRTAREYYDTKQYPQAIATADLLLARRPPVDTEKQRTAWTVIANGQFEQGQFDKAEGGYLQVQTLMSATDKERPAIEERLAASVYKQGEAKQQQGDAAGAVADYLRVDTLTPSAKIRATADYDAAALLIGLKEWPHAIEVLEGFRRNFPSSPLQPEVTRKLAVAQVEAGNAGSAAAEFERVANAPGESPDAQREALAQAAKLYEKSGQRAQAIGAWQNYVRRFPHPVAPAIEAHARLAELSAQQGDAQTHMRELQEIVAADRSAGAERSDRSRYLAAKASLELAAPIRDSFYAIQLTNPLKKSLAAKKVAMESALKAYSDANDYAVAEVSTAATYETGELYRHLGSDLMKSERPPKLSADELEQYNVLLEEQAYPFEEKAIEVHVANTGRAAQGVYDDWVKKSYAVLAQLKPARFAKVEQGEDYAPVPAPPPPAPPAPAPTAKAAKGKAKEPPPPEPAGPPPVTLATLQQFQKAHDLLDGGRNDEAAAALEALTTAAPAFAPAPLNLGILQARQGQWPQAQASLAEAIKRDPGSASAYAQLGVVDRNLGQFTDASTAYGHALEIDADNLKVHRNLGVLLDLYLGKPSEALDHYQRALALGGGADKQMTAWIAEVQSRLNGERKTAKVQ
jgi:tetratricopeptide (TPR) repeat protein